MDESPIGDRTCDLICSQDKSICSNLIFYNSIWLLVCVAVCLSSLSLSTSSFPSPCPLSAATGSGAAPQRVQPSTQFTGKVPERLPAQRASDASERHLPRFLSSAALLHLLLLPFFLPPPVAHLKELPKLPQQLCRAWQSVSYCRWESKQEDDTYIHDTLPLTHVCDESTYLSYLTCSCALWPVSPAETPPPPYSMMETSPQEDVKPSNSTETPILTFSAPHRG